MFLPARLCHSFALVPPVHKHTVTFREWLSENDFVVTILCLGRSAYFSHEQSWDPQHGDELAEGRYRSISFHPIEKHLKTYGGWDIAYEEKIAKFRK